MKKSFNKRPGKRDFKGGEGSSNKAKRPFKRNYEADSKPERKEYSGSGKEAGEKSSFSKKPFNRDANKYLGRKKYGDRENKSGEGNWKSSGLKDTENNTEKSKSSSYKKGRSFTRNKDSRKNFKSNDKEGFNREKNSFDRPYKRKFDIADNKEGFSREKRNFGKKDREYVSFKDLPSRRKTNETNETENSSHSQFSKPKRNFIKKDRENKPYKDKPSFYKGNKKSYGDNTDNKFDDSSSEKPKFRRSKRSFEKKEDQSFESLHNQNSLNKFTGDEGLIRLNKYISNAGICSRREADDIIRAGAVTVNGKIITEMGYKVKTTDVINYDGHTLKRESKVYVLLNKPKDYITTTSDPHAKQTVMELVADACNERLYPVGRLDRNTTGLLLFTNDGVLAARLTHPKFGIKKVYHVLLDKNLRPDDFKKLIEGVELEDGLAKPDDVSFVGETKRELGLEIHSGKNRVVRRMFEHLGYEVIKLDRTKFAGLTKKDLPRAKWRFLNRKEIDFLKMIG